MRGSVKHAKILFFLLRNGWQSAASLFQDNQNWDNMNFHQHSRETLQDRTVLLERETLIDNSFRIFLACRFESPAPWLSNSRQFIVLIWEAMQFRKTHISTKHSLKSILLKENWWTKQKKNWMTTSSYLKNCMLNFVVSLLWECLKIQMLYVRLANFPTHILLHLSCWGTIFQKKFFSSTCCVVLINKFVRFSAS